MRVARPGVNNRVEYNIYRHIALSELSKDFLYTQGFWMICKTLILKFFKRFETLLKKNSVQVEGMRLWMRQFYWYISWFWYDSMREPKFSISCGARKFDSIHQSYIRWIGKQGRRRSLYLPLLSGNRWSFLCSVCSRPKVYGYYRIGCSRASFSKKYESRSPYHKV